MVFLHYRERGEQMQRTFEDRVTDLKRAAIPWRARAISIVAPVLRCLNDGLMYCSLYMAKRRMGKRG